MVKTRSASTMLVIMVFTMAGSATAIARSDDSTKTGDDASRGMNAVAVYGTSTLVGESDPGTTTLDGVIVRVRDNVLVTAEASSDARVSGRATITVSFDAFPDQTGLPGSSQVRYGHARLENELGSWSGRFAGSLANGSFLQTYWLEGAGAYEGLSYVVTAGGNGNVWRSQGLIFPGEVPPLGTGNSLPLESQGADLPMAWSRPL